MNSRRLGRGLLQRSPESVQRAARRWLTGLHASAAAQAAALQASSRRPALAHGREWRYFTLYLPGVETPIYARPGTSDVQSFHDIFGRRQHAVDLGFAPRVVFDLGANVGYAALDLALRYPEAEVVAVEPEPSNVRVLRRNVAPFDRVSVVEAAVWPRVTSVELVRSTIGHTGFRVREAPGSVDAIETVTLPMLIDRFGGEGVDVLKIDIEGAEVELLTEESDWLARVRAVVIEFHDSFRPGCAEAGEAALGRAGLRPYADVGGTRYYVRRRSTPASAADVRPARTLL